MGFGQIATKEEIDYIHKRAECDGTQGRNSTPGFEKD